MRLRRAGRDLAALPALVRNAGASGPRPDAADAPLVSVVIATYNWSSVLRLAIRSALGQTYPRLEVVVVGDACTDDSAAVVESFGDERVRWHNLDQNSGSQSAPNNAGIALARGAYVAYLGHDDVWLPTHLALVVGALRREGADLAYSVTEELGPPGSGFRGLLGHTPRYTNGQNIPPSAIVHRRDLPDEIGPWKDYRTISLPPDREYVLRAYEHGMRIASVRALTVFKFNSGFRRNSYVEKPSHEQERYARRIEVERGFAYRELGALSLVLARSLVRSTSERLPQLPTPPDPVPPGWYVTQWRQIRGLEPEDGAVGPRTSEGGRG